MRRHWHYVTLLIGNLCQLFTLLSFHAGMRNFCHMGLTCSNLNRGLAPLFGLAGCLSVLPLAKVDEKNNNDINICHYELILPVMEMNWILSGLDSALRELDTDHSRSSL